MEIFIPIEKMKTPSFGENSEFGITVICGSLFSGKFQNSATQPYDATNQFHDIRSEAILNIHIIQHITFYTIFLFSAYHCG